MIHPFLVMNFFKMPLSMSWVYGAYEKKEKAALLIGEPKIVIAAGSSVHFGVNAQMIGEAFHRPSINYGVMALLDLDYIIYRLKRILKKGDLLIMPLEYEHYLYDSSARLSMQKKYHLLTFDQAFFYNHLSNFQKISTIYKIHPLMFIGSIYEQINVKKGQPSSGSYKIEDINEYGDETSNNPNIISVSKGLSMPKPTEESLVVLGKFHQWCKDRDIKLYLTFPNTAYFKDYELTEINKEIDRFIDVLTQRGLPVMGGPQDAMVPKELMFDTNYHLIKEGINLRTTRLINLMEKTMPNLFLQSSNERKIG